VLPTVWIKTCPVYPVGITKINDFTPVVHLLIFEKVLPFQGEGASIPGSGGEEVGILDSGFYLLKCTIKA
jgi:hypothetical protein